MKILVTGGAGFIGSNLVDKLIELNHDVVVLDNLRSGKKENLNPKAIFFQEDICDKEKMFSIFNEVKPEVVFHLAAQNEVPYSMDHPFEDQEINIVGTINLLEACKDKGVKKFVYSNTGGALYGDVDEEKLPIKEDEPMIKPTNFYGVSKRAAEVYVFLYCNLYKIIGISLRYSNVYGPRQDGNKEAGVVAIFTTKLLNKEQPPINGDGKNTRDYIYVEDAIDSNIKALDFERSDYFNISTGIRTTTLQVFDEIEKNLKTGIKPKHGPERVGDAKHNSLSPEKAKRILNWKALKTFSEGIKTTVNYYLKRDDV